MYISCYDSNEVNFNHSGRFKVYVPEDDNNIYRAVNGQFYATFKISLDDPFINYLMPRSIVKIPTPNKKNPYQLFRIIDLDDDDIGITFTAFHIAWDLSTGFLPNINIVGKNRSEACSYILEKAKESKPHRFKIVTKDISTEQKNLQIVRYNPLVALMGDKDNTVLNRYENIEFDFNNFDIEIYDKLGINSGFVIKDNKNINISNRILDYKPISTRIVPQGADELLLPEYYIDSPKIGFYDEVFYKHVVFNEIKVDEENGITKEIALDLLRNASLKLFSDAHIDDPTLIWNINFDDMQDNLNLPAELRDLMKLDLGDTVTVLKDRLDRLESRILEYNYNFVKGKYRDITISSVGKNFTLSLDKTVSEIEFKVDNFVSTVSNITGDIYTKIEQMSESISLKVSKGDEFESEFKQTSENFNFTLGSDSTNVEINKEALLIKRGAFKMINNKGEVAIQGDTDGNFEITKECRAKDRFRTENDFIMTSDGRYSWVMHRPENTKGSGFVLARSFNYGVEDWYWDAAFVFKPDVGGFNQPGIQFGQKGGPWLKSILSDQQIQARNDTDSGYVKVVGSSFINGSSNKLKTNITETSNLEALNILINNNIRKYNYKVEKNILTDIDTEAKIKNIELELETITADTKHGLVLEELTDEAKEYLNPTGTDGIDIYSMCSLLWNVCQIQEERIQILEKAILNS